MVLFVSFYHFTGIPFRKALTCFVFWVCWHAVVQQLPPAGIISTKDAQLRVPSKTRQQHTTVNVFLVVLLDLLFPKS